LDGAFPLIAEAAGALQVRSFLIDGEAVACGDDGVPLFDKVRSRRADRYVFLSAFDLLDINGLDLRCEPLEIRKRQLSMLLRNARFGLRFNDEPGDVVFRHACKLGFEGIVAAGLALSLQPILAGLRLMALCSLTLETLPPCQARQSSRGSADEVIKAVEPYDADQDEVGRDNIIQQSRHEQNQDAASESSERHDLIDYGAQPHSGTLSFDY
jgi:hypothetical protein